MCGFCGFVDTARGLRESSYEPLLEKMGRQIKHRGPDDGSTWYDAREGVGLSFRRLSILDLSLAGRQPKRSVSGRYVIVFNGEIYNHLEVREELAALGHEFSGRSDTETILAAVEQWGVWDSLGRFNGMFAMVLWDRKERALTLTRDRVGIKPLYYGWGGGAFLFGSALKPLLCYPGFAPEISPDSLSAYLQNGYIPTPRSIYKSVYKLPPGGVVTLPLAQLKRKSGDGPLSVEKYWDYKKIFLGIQESNAHLTDEEAKEQLLALVQRAVARRTLSDVPLGAFLSGGIDSSLTTALLQRTCTTPIQTFTIGYRESRFDESRRARQVARYLGTDHHELLLRPQEVMEVVSLMPTLYDEPFADSSQLPTYLVSQLARESVTVVLSGDGGDELFGGYKSYRNAVKLWSLLGRVPRPLRSGLALLFQGAAGVHDLLHQRLGRFPQRLERYQVGNRAQVLSQLAETGDPFSLFALLSAQFREPTSLLTTPASVEWPEALSEELLFSMRAQDFSQYLPDDILTKVDRASMGVSLEARVPLLDHQVVEFAFSLPQQLIWRDGVSKYLLKEVLYQVVPPSILDDPGRKQGFGVPVGAWIRGPLRPWAEELLSTSHLRSHGLFKEEQVRQVWEEHLSGRRNWWYKLWTLLMFQAWHVAQPW